ncbi:hypothetical protein [Pedobacter cryoconitis]|uniref:Uncharacterized protein n=1 Tax=Pedobacter cryoconitis TaxID=188932 RepID=A0A327SMZ3_9SPHI|nr:hypothetical protein [Pedobacter cryoconitis]RAJ28903.1 hypothetical protein LY11_03177 [Pedobacter cryoconitis]
MDLKQFLIDNPLISQTDLAHAMYPDTPKSAKSKLSNKLNNAKAGNGKQRITPEDERLALEALTKLGTNIETLKGG